MELTISSDGQGLRYTCPDVDDPVEGANRAA